MEPTCPQCHRADTVRHRYCTACLAPIDPPEPPRADDDDDDTRAELLRLALPLLPLVPAWLLTAGLLFTSKMWEPVQTIKGQVTPGWSLLGTVLVASVVYAAAPFIGTYLGGVRAHSRAAYRPATPAQAAVTTGCLRVFLIVMIYGYTLQFLRGT